jgi:DNA uptake protein ComE-like DNA-binding protein
MVPNWQTYFYFTKKELKGIMVLGCILLGSVLVSLIFSTKPNDQKLNAKLGTLRLFDFDPNTIDSVNAIQLGIPEKQVRTLMNYRAKGGYFKTPASFSKLYGMQNELFVQLIPYIKIIPQEGSTRFIDVGRYKKFSKESSAPQWKIDMNDANEKEWVTKTRIPISIIRRILAYRNYIGAFTYPNQIKKVYGFPDSLFQPLKPHLFIKPGTHLLLNANAMNFEQWKQLGLFTDRQVWVILKLKKENNGKIGWERIVEACDLSQTEALTIKQKVQFKD